MKNLKTRRKRPRRIIFRRKDMFNAEKSEKQADIAYDFYYKKGQKTKHYRAKIKPLGLKTVRIKLIDVADVYGEFEISKKDYDRLLVQPIAIRRMIVKLYENINWISKNIENIKKKVDKKDYSNDEEIIYGSLIDGILRDWDNIFSKVVSMSSLSSDYRLFYAYYIQKAIEMG